MSARRPAQRPAVPVLAAALLALAGCAGLTSEKPSDAVRPIELSYPYEVEGFLRFDGYRQTAAAAAAAYVRVVIRDRTSSESPGRDQAADTMISAASGTIVDAAGLVVTAAHIAIDTGFDAAVMTMDGRLRPARILAVDPARELAVLRIAPFAGMRAAVLADSDSVRRGDLVFAIGAPENRPGVVSLGTVVRPKWPRRLEYNGYGFGDGLKLYMKIEPGDSGGPVFNRRGEMIGVVATFVLGDTTQADDEPPRLAYAVPVKAVRAYLRALALP